MCGHVHLTSLVEVGGTLRAVEEATQSSKEAFSLLFPGQRIGIGSQHNLQTPPLKNVMQHYMATFVWCL